MRWGDNKEIGKGEKKKKKVEKSENPKLTCIPLLGSLELLTPIMMRLMRKKKRVTMRQSR